MFNNQNLTVKKLLQNSFIFILPKTDLVSDIFYTSFHIITTFCTIHAIPSLYKPSLSLCMNIIIAKNELKGQ